MDMTGKVVVITGASRGIGEAAARAFADAGAKVALVARSGDRIAQIAGEIGPGAIAIPCDVSRYWEMEAAINATVAEFGRLDVLIANAGAIEPISHMAEADPEAWGKIIDINLKGVFHGMRAALPVMLEQGEGAILSISSGAAHGPVEGWSHYCSSKAGAHMLNQMLHKEYAEAGIRAIGLSPGTVATEMQREIKASGINPVSQLQWEDHIPPEWVAKCLMWMATPDADEWLGKEISLRQPEIRDRLGLT
ncbi:SDR family oxidoreductase [Flavimaricola marinus]|uniref:Putative oxidoreductase n=1 Tax=Flavimaricola marinus TaxID=1819565 RepID=A0A238LFF8_9RHOB|nr:SDR family oxidoreductase [Flavimaricola marinus]SMY08322.1 putative oxidoreductase [Flavimaricola marinus]